MLKLEKEDFSDEFWDAQHSQLGAEDYYQDVLLPLVKAGNWNELEKLPVLCAADGSPLIMFKDNCWDFSDKQEDLFGKNGNIHFTFETARGQNKTRNGKILEKNIANEIKCFALLELFFSHKKIAIRSLISPVSKLVYCANFMLSQGVNTFDGINFEQLLEYVHNGLDVSERGAKTITTLNRLAELEEFLPFKTNLSEKLTAESLNVVIQVSNQHPVIPLRIYIGLMQELTRIVEEIYKYRSDLEDAIERVLAYRDENMQIAKYTIRSGVGYSLYSIVTDPSARELLAGFEQAGVPIVDHCKYVEWENIWNRIEPSLRHSAIRPFSGATVGKNFFATTTEFQNFLSTLDTACKWLLLALSGMRVDELYHISPVYGMQEYQSGKNTIYLLSTRQSKITLTSQTKDDVYVTTKTGKKAFDILNAIHSPYRKRLVSEQHRMFVSIKNTNWHKTAEKTAIGKLLSDRINSLSVVQEVLSPKDCEHLRVSDPTRTDFKVGDRFFYSNHQLRRSFSYYLIGYELLSFPQLKQQLGHLSLEMTRWYAMNSSSFQKIYREVATERNKQQAEVLARIYNRMANSERIAGGLGLSLTDLVTKEGKLHFEKTENKRKLSAEYWQAEIKANRAHIHAIAPGMYCTKSECAMRISIDLSECVDCGWDLIEDVVYAETARMDAMRNLLFLHDSGELNKSSASKYIMQIRSAEKIMTDIGFEHEQFAIPTEAEAMLINVSEVV
jgi:integrase